MKQTIAIIHYNTPELTEACIKSIRKQGCQWPVLLFDNSDERPFTAKMKGVKVVDNTKGQIIDFDRWLDENFPDREPRHARACNFGSAKHIYTVQRLWELLPKGFLLVESDTLCRRDISDLWREQYAAVGEVEQWQEGNQHHVPRLLPMLCYMNVPKLVKAGARYYDPLRCWCLQKGEDTRGNWYDTGACLLEDIKQMKPDLVGQNVFIGDYIVHYDHGSWFRNDLQAQQQWLEQNASLWK